MNSKRTGRNDRRGGGGSKSETEARMEKISRLLSRTLRHSAHEEKLNMREDGYVNVDELLKSHKYRSIGINFDEIRKVVAENSKKRFKLIKLDDEVVGTPTPPLLSDVSVGTSTDPSISTDPRITNSVVDEDVYDDDPNPDVTKYWIRAVQGHSIKIEESLLLQPITLENLPSICVHGTYYNALTLIIESGHLSKMGRTHIHCAAGLPRASIHPETGEEIPAVLSGMRFDAEALFYIDVEKGIRDGIEFWRSDNNVILTNGRDGSGYLDLEYIIRVEDSGGRAGGGDLWNREEGRLKEWPVSRKTKRVGGGGGRGNASGGGRGKGKGSSRPKVQVESALDDLGDTLEDTRL